MREESAYATRGGKATELYDDCCVGMCTWTKARKEMAQFEVVSRWVHFPSFRLQLVVRNFTKYTTQ